MLWLAAYLTGFPPVGLHAFSWTHGLAPGIAMHVLYVVSAQFILLFDKYLPKYFLNYRASFSPLHLFISCALFSIRYKI